MNTFFLRTGLIAAFAIFSGALSAAPVPTLDKDPVGFFRFIESSQTPQAKAMRQEIADGPAALTRERIAAQKEGIAVFPAQLNQPLPPDDQNAAPLYLKAAALRKGKVMLPIYAETLSARYSYTSEQLARVQKIYDDNPDVFALLRQATDRPKCVFAHDWSKGVFNLPIGQYASLRETARELTTESVLQAEGGHYADATASQSRVYRVAEHVASDPTLIGYLVGFAIDSIATRGMQDILTLAGPNADVDAQVEQAVTDKPAHLSLHHALNGELAITDAYFVSLRRGGASDFQTLLSDSNNMTRRSPLIFTPRERKGYGNLLDAAEANYIHQMRGLIRAADTPGEGAAFAQAGREAQTPSSEIVQEVAHRLSPLQYGTLDELPKRAAASRAITRAAAAVLAERAKTGTYPASLPGAFPDPFTRKPLGYRREGASGFVVYSAGLDGKYDGGNVGDKALPGMAQYRFRYPIVPIPVPPEDQK